MRLKEILYGALELSVSPSMWSLLSKLSSALGKLVSMSAIIISLCAHDPTPR